MACGILVLCHIHSLIIALCLEAMLAVAKQVSHNHVYKASMHHEYASEGLKFLKLNDEQELCLLASCVSFVHLLLLQL